MSENKNTSKENIKSLLKREEAAHKLNKQYQNSNNNKNNKSPNETNSKQNYHHHGHNGMRCCDHKHIKPNHILSKQEEDACDDLRKMVNIYLFV